LPANVPLDPLFFTRVNRRVRKDATFSLGADLWEMATDLRGQIVTAAVDDWQYRKGSLRNRLDRQTFTPTAIGLLYAKAACDDERSCIRTAACQYPQ
jgi:hypothetical protein